MNTPCLGIDISFSSFVAAIWFDDKRIATAQFANTPAGFGKLQRWVQSHGLGPVPTGIESTNTYAEALAHWLHERHFGVYLLNPEHTANYARCCGQRNKTDPADARLIAAYVAKHSLTPWIPAPPEQRHLRDLTRVRAQLLVTQRDLQNQLRTAAAPARPYLEAVLQKLKQQLLTLLKAIAEHLKQYPSLGEQVRRLMTHKGVGLVTAAIVIAELPPVTAQTDPRALCAWCGLTPQRWQSGNTERPAHLSRKGNCYLRQALFMPALVAKKHNPLLRAFAQSLLAKGKRPASVVGAVAHKMLRILIGMLKHQSDFDPNWSPKPS